jgi:2-dehydropantoate 2-reductase
MVNNKLMTKRLDNIVVVGQGAMGLLWYHHLSQDNISSSDLANVNSKITLLASNQDLLSSNELKNSRYQFTSYQQDHAKSYPLNYSNQIDIKSADIILSYRRCHRKNSQRHSPSLHRGSSA